MNAMKRLMMLLLIGSSVLCLTRCATPSERIVTREVKPPTILLEPCKRPNVRSIETNGDLAKLASELMFSLDVCAAQIEALRVFYQVEDSADTP